MHKEDCLFCQIALGRESAKVVWENEDFLAFENKYPKAPVHILVIPREHQSKDAEMLKEDQGRWALLMGAVFEVIRIKNLNKTGYKLASYGAGYNHFDHEHVHVIGGMKEPPREV
jgi:histidine triad (HIT) family protein